MKTFQEYIEDNLEPIDQVEYFNEILDCEGTVTVAGYEFYPSDILEKLDPIAYRCGISDVVGTSDFTEFEDEYYHTEDFDRVKDEYVGEVESKIEDIEEDMQHCQDELDSMDDENEAHADIIHDLTWEINKKEIEIAELKDLLLETE